jgi:hypothetical protein
MMKIFLLLTFAYCPLWGGGRGKKYSLILKLIASPKKLSLRRPCTKVTLSFLSARHLVSTNKEKS